MVAAEGTATSPTGPVFDDITDPAAFAAALRELAESAGVRPADLADRLDAPHATVTGFLTGRALPAEWQRELLVALLGECGVADDDLEPWLDCWLRLRRPLDSQRDTTPPYRGLDSYQPEHAAWYFGRERLTETLVRRVDERSGMLVVVGPSGSGKSSLLRAGLLPTLSTWHGVLVTPGPQPLPALADALIGVLDSSTSSLVAELRSRPDVVAERVRAAAGRPTLLVVDQFEEVFTRCDSEGERQLFVAALHAFGGIGPVVIGIRADFYPHALRYPYLAGPLQDNQVVLAPMRVADLRRAVMEPARRLGVIIDDDLVQLVLAELTPGSGGVAAAPGGSPLPLLSHAMLVTWAQGGRRRMTVDAYTSTGGVHGAVTQSAEAAYTDLDGSHALVRKLFLRLTQIGPDGVVTGRARTLAELTAGADADEVRHVLARFVDQRLLTAELETVRLSHDALLWAWPRLRGWIEEARAAQRVHRELDQTAQAWADGGHDPSGLYRATRLIAVREALTGTSEPLSSVQRRFLDASTDADGAAAQAAARRRRLRRRMIVVLVVLAVVAGAVAAVTVGRAVGSSAAPRAAGESADTALARRSALLTAAGSPRPVRIARPGGGPQLIAATPSGGLLAGAGTSDVDSSVRLWDLSRGGRPALLPTELTGHSKAVRALAVSPGGDTLATASADGTVRLWNLGDPRATGSLGAPIRADIGEVDAVAFSPDGGLLAAGGAGRVRLWDVRDRVRPVAVGQPLAGLTGAVLGLSWRGTGRVLAAVDSTGAIPRWDLTDPALPVPLGLPMAVPGTASVTFGPDGLTLYTEGGGELRVWTVTDPAAPVLAVGPLTATAFALSPSGRLLAVASNGRVQVLDAASRAAVSEFADPDATALTFRDDRTLLSGTDGGVVRSWPVTGPTVPGVRAYAVKADGTLVATAGSTVRLWSSTADGLAPLGAPLAESAEVLAFDGDLLIGARPDGLVLWNVRTPSAPAQLAVVRSGTATPVSIRAAGGRVVVTDRDGTVGLFDVRDPAVPIRVSAVVAAGEPALSPDGRQLAAIVAGAVRRWDLTDLAAPKPVDEPAATDASPAVSLTYRPGGTQLAVGAANGTVRLLDTRGVPTAEPLVGPDGPVRSVAAGSDGALAATTGSGRIWLWEPDGAELSAVLDPPAATPPTMTFAGSSILFTGAGGVVTRYPTDVDAVATRLCTGAGADLPAGCR